MAEGGDEFAVLALGTDGDAEAVLAELHAGAVSDDDALIHEVVVDAGSVTHLCQQEVGLCGVHFLADRQFGKGLHHAGALLEQHLHPLLNVDGTLQCLKGLLLSERINVVRIFHLVKELDNFL